MNYPCTRTITLPASHAASTSTSALFIHRAERSAPVRKKRPPGRPRKAPSRRSVERSLISCSLVSRARLLEASFAAIVFSLDAQVYACTFLPLQLSACAYIVGPSNEKGVCAYNQSLRYVAVIKKVVKSVVVFALAHCDREER